MEHLFGNSTVQAHGLEHKPGQPFKPPKAFNYTAKVGNHQGIVLLPDSKFIPISARGRISSNMYMNHARSLSSLMLTIFPLFFVQHSITPQSRNINPFLYGQQFIGGPIQEKAQHLPDVRTCGGPTSTVPSPTMNGVAPSIP